MPSIEELKNTHNRASNVRKALHGLLFVAPANAEVPESLISGGDITLPEEYRSVGLVEKGDGFTIGREVDTEEVEALGYGTPVRIDVTSATQTIGVTALETNAVTRELVDGLDLSTVQAANGEVSWEHPDIPPAIYYRVLVITADGAPGNWIYEAEVLPRARVTETGDVSKNSADASQYEITFTGLLDDDTGYARKSFMGGSGFDAATAGFGTSGGDTEMQTFAASTTSTPRQSSTRTSQTADE